MPISQSTARAPVFGLAMAIQNLAWGFGTPLFAPSLDGGAFAGLHSVVEPGELVELAARVLAHPALVSAQREDA